MLRIDDKLAEPGDAALRRRRCSASRSAARWCASPSIYLMDEPLSSLDAKLRADLRLELKRIQQRARRDHALRHARPDRGDDAWPTASACSTDGRLVQIGTPREIYERPGEPATSPRGWASRASTCCRVGLLPGADAAGRHGDHRRAHRAPDASRAAQRPRAPTARSTGSSIWATRTIVHVRIGDGRQARDARRSPDAGFEPGDAVGVELRRARCSSTPTGDRIASLERARCDHRNATRLIDAVHADA